MKPLLLAVWVLAIQSVIGQNCQCPAQSYYYASYYGFYPTGSQYYQGYSGPYPSGQLLYPTTKTNYIGYKNSNYQTNSSLTNSAFYAVYSQQSPVVMRILKKSLTGVEVTIIGPSGATYALESTYNFLTWARVQGITIPNTGQTNIQLPIGVRRNKQFFRLVK